MLAFLVWALLACSAAYWAIQLLARPLPVPAHTVPAGDGATARGDLSRLLGTTAAAPAEEPSAAPVQDSRFRLVGLVAPKQGLPGHQGEGVALISVDGAAARAVRIGAVVDAELRLLALDLRSAALGQDGVTTLTLRLEPPPPAATGALPAATLVGAAPAAAAEPASQEVPPAAPEHRHDGAGLPAR